MTPEWVKHAIFYQVFPDRFARSQRCQHPASVKFLPWGSPPEQQGFQGGDLYGVAEKLDYLSDLGVSALYLNPIFSSASNHRYHTFDYFEVDPLLGGKEAFRFLLDEAHQRSMRVVLDGVFNHASRGFWPFHHVLENGGDSPYLDWFIVHDWPLRPYSSTEEDPPNYAAWWNLPALPKLNTTNPDVQEYIFDVARYWLDFGIDGWRLDVPQEIDDVLFWQKFRRIVKSANPEAYICGEIWEEAGSWLQGDQFDAVMNYIFTWATLGFLGGPSVRSDYQREHLDLSPRDAGSFGEVIDYMLGLYPWDINQVQLNLLGSHDMARPLWILNGDVEALKLCYFFMLTFPGAPCIYYGDEIGLSAGDDPYCREAFPWHNAQHWNTSLQGFIKNATQLRRSFPVLRTGQYESLWAQQDVFGFRRHSSEEEMAIFLNRGSTARMLPRHTIPDGTGRWQVVWKGEGRVEKGPVTEDEFVLGPQSAIALWRKPA